MKIGKQILMPAYLRPKQKTALARLAKAMDVPQQALLREALDDLLLKHGELSGYDSADALMPPVTVGRNAIAEDAGTMLRSIKRRPARRRK